MFAVPIAPIKDAPERDEDDQGSHVVAPPVTGPSMSGSRHVVPPAKGPLVRDVAMGYPEWLGT